MIGEEYILYHDKIDSILGREIEELNSDFFMAQSDKTGKIACNPGTLSPLARTLEMTVYNSGTGTSIPACDRTCFVGANAGLVGEPVWSSVFEDTFNIDSGPSGTGVWALTTADQPFVGYEAFGVLTFNINPSDGVGFNTAQMITGTGSGPLIPNAVMQLDRPCRVTFAVASNVQFSYDVNTYSPSMNMETWASIYVADTNLTYCAGWDPITAGGQSQIFAIDSTGVVVDVLDFTGRGTVTAFAYNSEDGYLVASTIASLSVNEYGVRLGITPTLSILGGFNTGQPFLPATMVQFSPSIPFAGGTYGWVIVGQNNTPATPIGWKLYLGSDGGFPSTPAQEGPIPDAPISRPFIPNNLTPAVSPLIGEQPGGSAYCTSNNKAYFPDVNVGNRIIQFDYALGAVGSDFAITVIPVSSGCSSVIYNPELDEIVGITGGSGSQWLDPAKLIRIDPHTATEIGTVDSAPGIRNEMEVVAMFDTHLKRIIVSRFRQTLPPGPVPSGQPGIYIFDYNYNLIGGKNFGEFSDWAGLMRPWSLTLQESTLEVYVGNYDYSLDPVYPPLQTLIGDYTPYVKVNVGSLGAGTDGTQRSTVGTFTETYNDVGNGALEVNFGPPVGADFGPVVQTILEYIIVEQVLGNGDVVSQGFCINVNVNGDTEGLKALSNDTLANPFRVKGLRIVSRFQELLQQIWTIRYTLPTGKVTTTEWQPQNYISPTNANGFVVDAPEFDFPIDSKFSICTRTPWVETTELAYWTIIFTIQEELNDSGKVFFDQPIQKSNLPRPSGNPIVRLLNSKK